jgi:hypothetical protein
VEADALALLRSIAGTLTFIAGVLLVSANTTWSGKNSIGLRLVMVTLGASVVWSGLELLLS